MLGLPGSSQKPLVRVRICLAAVPWHGGKRVRVSLLELVCVSVCVCVSLCKDPSYTWVYREARRMKMASGEPVLKSQMPFVSLYSD